MHPPFAIYGLLFTLAMAGALFAGYGMAGSKTRSWIHMIGFAAAICDGGKGHHGSRVSAARPDPAGRL
jgi:hypothetical protein